MDSFAFTPANGFNDASTFTDPASEAETRSQLFSPHEQTRDYINNTIVPAINTLQTQVQAISGAVGDPEALQEILDAIASIQDFLTTTDELAYVG